MSRKKFKLDIRGFREEVFKADYMRAAVAENANEIADKAGDGFEPSVSMGKTRWHGKVSAVTVKAAIKDNENNTLQKAAYPLQVVNK